MKSRARECQREYESRAAVNTVVLHPNQVKYCLLFELLDIFFFPKILIDFNLISER